MNVYFDNAATTKVRGEVIDDISNVLKDCFGNPSSPHSFGRSAKSYIETSRKSIAKILNCQPSEIIFNSGGTESDNSILKCAVKDLGIKHIISSKIEHHAVTHTLDDLELQGVNVHYVKLSENGNIDIDNLEHLLSFNNEPKLVTLMYINNEIGNILDVKSVSDLCQKYNSLFHTDAVQSVGHYNLDLSLIPIDFLAASAHKFHGPKGIGFAFVRSGLGLQPIITGGAQERGCRAGTESIHDIVGLDTALSIAYQNLESEKQHIQSLKSYFIDRLKAEVSDVGFNGCCDNFEKSTYTLVNVCLPVSTEKTPLFLFQLDLKGIACSKGSACQSGSDSGSHVLREFLSEEALKKPSIRFSFSKYNTKSEIDEVIGVLKDLVLEPA